MRIFYLDTNVFISNYKRDDPYHSSSVKIVEGLRQGRIEAYTCVLTILETAAVASRNYEKGIHLLGASRMIDRRRLIGALLKRLLNLNIHFVNLPGETSMKLLKKDITMPIIFHESLSLALKIGLKSLDLIHLSSAKYAKETLKVPIQAFVTGDEDFLNRKDKLSEIIDFPFLTPSEYASALGI
ncbi:MAG: type II toxin-antitoxin system VapC family toxin [Candidatus Bathyarchaeia archaeon]